jgi:uncharacterized membrane protein YidH (DUF202 family)
MSEELDPTQATERTLLAWNRSALAVGLIGALAIRAGAVGGSTPAYVLGGILLALALATWAYGHAAYRSSRRRLVRGQPLARPQAIRAVTVATSVAGVAAFVLVLLG